MFTAGILSRCTVHKGLIIPKAVWLQTTLVRYLPYFIAAINCTEHYLMRGMLLTADDYLFMVIFCISVQIETDWYQKTN